MLMQAGLFLQPGTGKRSASRKTPRAGTYRSEVANQVRCDPPIQRQPQTLWLLIFPPAKVAAKPPNQRSPSRDVDLAGDLSPPQSGLRRRIQHGYDGRLTEWQRTIFCELTTSLLTRPTPISILIKRVRMKQLLSFSFRDGNTDFIRSAASYFMLLGEEFMYI